MALELPDVPDLLEPLPELIEEALAAYRDANSIFEGGETTGAALLFWTATERVSRWLEITRQVIAPSVEGTDKLRIHANRRATLRRLLIVSPSDTANLGAHQRIDIYHNREPGGTREDIDANMIGISQDAAQRILLGVANHASLLSDGQKQSLRRAVSNMSPALTADDLISMLESAVQVARHDGRVNASLDALLRRYSTPVNGVERKRAGRLAVMAATRARNMGQMDGKNGVVAWTSRALELCDPISDPGRNAYLRRLASIGHAYIGDWPKAKRELDVESKDVVHTVAFSRLMGGRASRLPCGRSRL